MATHDYIISNASGAAVRSDLNNALAAIVSNNSSATEPATTYAYMWWADTTSGQLKLRNAANDDWVVLLELDGTTLMEDGTVSAPGLAFADDTNTGFYRPAADSLGIATNGTNAVYIDSSQNVGIGTASPGGKLVVSDGSTTFQFDPVGGTGNILRSLTSGGARDALLFDAAQYAYSNGATEYARIDSSGRLLVGTSTARSNFYNSTNTSRQQIEGVDNDGATAAIVQTVNAAGLGGQLILAKSNGTGVGANGVVPNGQTLGRLSFQGNDGTEFVEGASIFAQADGATSANDLPTRLLFATTADGAASPTERMRIASDGLISVPNDTTVDKRRTVFSTGGSDPSFQLGFSNGSGTGADTEQGRLDFRYGSTSIGRIGFWRSGGAACNRITVIAGSNGVYLSQNATSWTSASDERLKTDLVPIVDALDKIGDVRAFTGRYHTDEPEVSRAFLIAQDFQSILPEAVNESNPDELGLNYSEVIPLLVAALKESKERIEILEAKVAALESA